jgi:hypothetical protein
MDWRADISKDDQRVLDNLLLKIEKYRHVYENSENPQLTQLWLIMLEMAKDSGKSKSDNFRIMAKILHPKKTEIMDTIENY